MRWLRARWGRWPGNCAFADSDQAYAARVIGEAVRGTFWSVDWIVFLK